MRFAVQACLAAFSLSVAGCGSSHPSERPAHANAAQPAGGASAGSTTVVSATTRPVVRRFVGIPMPPNNALDLDRTVIVGDGNDWLGRIFFSAPMSVDQTIEFYRRDMPHFGWTELAVTRSDTSVLAYQEGGRLATIELTPAPNGGTTRVEFWVNPLRARDRQQAARPQSAQSSTGSAESLAGSAPTVPAPPPHIQIDGQRAFPAAPPRAVEQAPLPPLNSP